MDQQIIKPQLTDKKIIEKIKYWYADYDGNISKKEIQKHFDIIKKLNEANKTMMRIVITLQRDEECYITEPPVFSDRGIMFKAFIMRLSKTILLRVGMVKKVKEWSGSGELIEGDAWM